MRRFRTTIVLALATLLSISICSAQQAATTSVPNLIRYSGTLKDAQGAALSSSTAVGVTFSIYKQQDGGASVWMETQNVTPDSNGQYNVILGSTTATGLPDDLFLQQEQRWLGVQVQGEAEQGRVLLVSVPYAFKAHEAETLGGLPASAFVKAPPSDGSGSGSTGSNNGTSVNALGNVGNAGKASKGKGADGKGPLAICTPVPGRIILWDKDGSECSSNLFQVIDPLSPYLGNIGIGLINPSKQLDVNFNVNARQWYDIGFPETRIVAVHTNPAVNPAPSGSTNLFLGWNAAGPDPNTQINGSLNTFTGFSAGFTNGAASSVANTYNGTYAGYTNLGGNANTMVGANAGFANLDSFNTCVGSSACQNHRNGGGGTYVGNAAGLNDVNGRTNSFFGDASGDFNVGDFNTFLGDRAGFNNHGSNNTFSGYQSGFGNHGNNNTFSGYQSGIVNTADGNSFYGYWAGKSNLGGSQNAFFGNWAGLSNVIGGANTFAGNGAGYQHIDGDQDTFVGTSAGFNDYHGKANTCIGASACQDNDGPGHVTGNHDTAVGVGAGLLAFGSHNTFTGYGAGSGVLNQSNGNYNTFTGESAGAANTTGWYNTSYGYLAGINNATGNSNVYLANFGANENNTMRIGMRGIGNQEIHTVFFDPILDNPTPLLKQVVTINSAGQLGYNTITGGGGVQGNCPLGPGYITQWLSPTPTTPTVGCSGIFQAANGNIGMGPNPTNPSKELDVNGEINARKWYDIGLPETPVLSIGLGPTGSIGDGNLFVGAQAGNNNPIPFGQDTFVGYQAGFNATTATLYNTFIGYQAGYGGAGGNTGTLNTFTGWQAGIANTTGGVNVFDGAFAGRSNRTGGGNTFLGYATGVSNQVGSNNTYLGHYVGTMNDGVGNTFVGDTSGNSSVCSSGTCANYNSFFGSNSGGGNTTGSNNIALGFTGGSTNTTGNNDIYIGNVGAGIESNTIRIGGTNVLGYGPQTDTYIAGIHGSSAGIGSPFESVCVDNNGKLWGVSALASCITSSRRFKEQIAGMGDTSSRLFQLRPVSFFYKAQYDDGSHLLQYGLIAEEVAKVYPEMVVYDKDGQPYTVKYQMLTPMLLNELQKQHKVVTAQQDELQTQLQQIKAQRHEIDGLKLQLQQQNASLQERLTKLESYVATQMKTASDNPPQTTPGANGGLQ